MDNNIENLKHIRSMMERSSKVLTLSGMSGVVAGSFALFGAYLAYLTLGGRFTIANNLIVDLFLIAVSVVVCASSVGLYFSVRKAKRMKSKFWQSATLNLLKDFMIPMISGGVFCLILLIQNVAMLIPSAMLIFYGIALVSVGARTYSGTKILGGCELFLGLLAGVFIQYNIFIWAIGFGLLHIVYGIVIYFKYDNTVASTNI